MIFLLALTFAFISNIFIPRYLAHLTILFNIQNQITKIPLRFLIFFVNAGYRLIDANCLLVTAKNRLIVSNCFLVSAKSSFVSAACLFLSAKSFFISVDYFLVNVCGCGRDFAIAG